MKQELPKFICHKWWPHDQFDCIYPSARKWEMLTGVYPTNLTEMLSFFEENGYELYLMAPGGYGCMTWYWRKRDDS